LFVTVKKEGLASTKTKTLAQQCEALIIRFGNRKVAVSGPMKPVRFGKFLRSAYPAQSAMKVENSVSNPLILFLTQVEKSDFSDPQAQAHPILFSCFHSGDQNP
jgi:hypothetical protein